MAGLLRGGFAMGLLALALATPAEGHGFGWRRGWTSGYYYGSAYYYPAYRASYYYPASYYPASYYPGTYYPATYYPATYSYPQPMYQCPSGVPAIYYAQPRPAPPSSTLEPPTDKTQRGPKITEARYADGSTKQAEGADHCKVGFWNLTGRDVTLVIEGQTRSLPKDRVITLDLTRQFAWKMDQGDLRNETVPADQNAHEIMLRAKAGR